MVISKYDEQNDEKKKKVFQKFKIHMSTSVVTFLLFDYIIFNN